MHIFDYAWGGEGGKVGFPEKSISFSLQFTPLRMFGLFSPRLSIKQILRLKIEILL